MALLLRFYISHSFAEMLRIANFYQSTHLYYHLDESHTFYYPADTCEPCDVNTLVSYDS